MAELPPTVHDGELLPGSYVMELELPDHLLRRINDSPAWRRRVTEYVSQQVDAGTEFRVDAGGGGVQNNADGTRVLAVRFTIRELDAAGEVDAAVALVPVLLISAGIAAVLGVTAMYVSDRILRIRVLEAGGDPGSIPSPFEGIGGAGSALSVGLGLLALAWLASTLEKARAS